MTNRYSGSLKASRYTPTEVLEQKRVAEDEQYQQWQSLGGDNLDAAYDEAMKVRLADDYDSMRASILTGEANAHTNRRANNRGRQAFYLAHNIRQARQELAGLDRGSEQWIQQVSDREDRLQDLLAMDDSDLNEAEMNFIIDLSGGRYDSVLGGQTSGETSASVGAGKSSEAENRPFNLAEAASDPNIDDATRRTLIDINNLLTVKPQLAIEGAKPNISAGGSQVEQEAQRLVDEINRSSLTPEQRAAVQGMVDGITADIDRPLHGNETPEDSDDSQVPVPTGPLEGDQAVREGESLEEYEARISSNAAPIDKIDVNDNEEEESDGSESKGDGSGLESDANVEGIVGIRKKWAEYMLTEYKSEMEEREQARQEFLKIMAKSQKGHLRRIKPDGFVARSLRSLFAGVNGNKLADFLTKPTNDEKAAGDRYAEALAKIDSARHNFMGHEYDNGNMSLEELKAERALFMTTEHANNTRTIAELQKDSSGKPMNKWWRRAGYVGAGVAGGLLALTPLGWVGGLTAAAAGAGAIRVSANKRNANLKSKNFLGGSYSVVDGIAEHYGRRFVTDMNSGARAEEDREISADDIVGAHYDETSNEIGKNRNRLLKPIMGAVATAAVVKGFGDFMTTSKVEPGEPDVPDESEGIVEQPEEAKPDIQGREFTVESGNGYTHELQDFAEVNGKELSGDDAYRLHLELQDKFGNDYIDINGPGSDIYYEVGDTRLAEPGAASWKEGVPEYINQWMANR